MLSLTFSHHWWRRGKISPSFSYLIDSLWRLYRLLALLCFEAAGQSTQRDITHTIVDPFFSELRQVRTTYNNTSTIAVKLQRHSTLPQVANKEGRSRDAKVVKALQIINFLCSDSVLTTNRFMA
jgi:hypothetical protein